MSDHQQPTQPHKPTGLEMMLTSLLRAAGFDPTILTAQVDAQVKAFFTAIQHLQERLDAIDARQARMEQKMDAICNALHVPEQTEHNGVPVLAITKRMEN
jgi:hypothetical protein